MTNRSRFARALIPRFGILWMATAMLLVVSGAGWWKFHRDLYIEERMAFEGALREGATLQIALFESPLEGEPSDEPIPWNAPLLPPIELVMAGPDLPNDARDELLRLPRLKEFRRSNRWTPLPQGSELPTPEFLERVDFSLPRLPEPTIDETRLDGPLPDGPDLDAAETRAVADALFAAWNAPRATDERLLVVSRYGLAFQTTPDASPDVRVHWLEDRRLFQYEATAGLGQHVVTIDGSIKRIVESATGGWRKFSRVFETNFESQRGQMRTFPYDDYPYHAAAFPTLIDADRALHDMPRFDLLRAAKIDDVRYRVEFARFSIPRTTEEMDTHVVDPAIDRWTAIVRSDLDWVPEEVEIQATVDYLRWPPGMYPAGPIPVERRTSQRFRKEGDRVFLVERLSRYQEASVFQGVWRGLYAVERNPDLDVDPLFDPDRFDPEPWPERRELPWLRWYRVTFALGCGLALFLVGRKALPRRKPSADPFAAPASDIEEPQPEPAA